jgi:glyoxylate/hydroxypyruvate reductase A
MVDPAMNAAMAETALWATLALHRGFFGYARQQQAALWQPQAQQRADEVPVAVLGFGQMGRAVVQRLMQQGYPVTAWRRGREAASGAVESPPGGSTVGGARLSLLQGAPALQQVLAGARIVLNLLPLTAQTRGLFDARRLAWLPRGAALVNLARGAHVVDAELLAALDGGQIGHAVLDVFGTEPLPPEHPYWRHPRVTVLPHAAAQTDARSAAAVVARNIEALAAGLPLRHLVARDSGY